MISYTDWAFIIKCHLKSSMSEKCIKEKLKKCIVGRNYGGGYIVDGELVWKEIIIKDPQCADKLKEYKIKDYIDIESYYENHKYHNMWSEYRSIYKKK